MLRTPRGDPLRAETDMDLAYPFRGRWLVRNSPADRVPSHGTTAFASSYAIDFVPVDHRGRTAPIRLRTLVGSEAPQRFPGFGRPVLAPAAGLVIAACDEDTDHDAYRGLPSIGYALTQGRRADAGWPALAGNHVLIRTPAGPVVALCHLQQASLRVQEGQQVRVGQPIAGCGSTGNSTEPHLHVQVLDRPDPVRAEPVPLSFNGAVPRSGRIVQA